MSTSINPSPQPRTRRRGWGCCGLIVVLFVAAILFSAVRYFLDQRTYNEAHQAYQQADCEAAIRSYDKLLSTFRLADFGQGYEALAQQERIECQAFQDAAERQTSSDPGGAILAYNDFMHNYGDSPLTQEASNRVASVFTQTDAQTLATEGLCDQLESLEQGNLIPQKDSNLPGLLYACGQTYEATENYSGAVQVYERILNDYPGAVAGTEVEDALARAIVAEARAAGAGTIPAPQVSGTTEGGSTVVIIQNDSPDRLRLVFSGPDSRIEEIEPCESCEKYSVVGPVYCPEKGPIGQYTLPPGQYDVVVQSVSDSGVTPWTGNWELISGDEYYSCFFITTTLSP